jgi:threonyl-tRNA synthetase
MGTMLRASSPDKLDGIRHSLAHLLAAAALKKYPKAKLGIGPTIEHGFYYDIKFPRPITPEELKEFEREMRGMIRQSLAFKGRTVTPATAKKLFKDQPFKLDLVREFVKDKKKLTVYQTGDIFLDLCRGGHVKNTSEINPEAFALTHLAGAYWRGSEKNPQLTRIYGLAFNTKEELEAHLAMLEEAKRRDHRKLGQELGIFMIDDTVGKGLPIWLPNGAIVRNEIEKYAEEMEKKYGYLRVVTPHLAKEELFLRSGHLPYYKEGMYPAMKMDDGTYYLKAMNCPIHHLIYKHRPRSYRELPLRLAEYGTVYRNELSGTLAGLLRVRMLSMNDAHIYCTKDQIESEMKNVIDLTLEYFRIFGLSDYWFRLSKWSPKHKEKYINEPKNWTYAEGVLRKVLTESGVRFVEVPDEAAFYGPKVDIQFKSVIGREETMSTVQLDFAAKRRFGLAYADKDGRENPEVFVIHRAPLSTHERFVAFLLEHYAGAFPAWLAPVQARVLPVGEKFEKYAAEVLEELIAAGVRAETGPADETLGKRIRHAETEKIPYVLVVGEKEEKNRSVSVRHYKRGQEGEKKTAELTAQLRREIESRAA